MQKGYGGYECKPATTHPLATQEIDGMIEMIQTLIDKGFAYEVTALSISGVKNFKEYGKLSHKNLEDLQSGFRSLQVSGEDQKEIPWTLFYGSLKKKESLLGISLGRRTSRLAYRVLCNVQKISGEEIDIHAGGEDLIFPHHENEIAQSECCNGKTFAILMHNAFLNIDNRKMSKSLGNFFTVRVDRGEVRPSGPAVLYADAHYRSPLNFSAELMESSKKLWTGLSPVQTS